MNSLERISACLNGIETDRPAVFMLLSLYGARMTGCPLEKYYSDPEMYLEGQKRTVQSFQSDVLTSPFAIGKEILAFGGSVRFYENQPPNIIRNPISRDTSLDCIQWPDINQNHHLLYFRDSVRRMAEVFGKAYPLAAPWLGPFELATGLIGLERLMEMVVFKDPQLEGFLRAVAQYTIDWGNTLLGDGATFLVHPATFSNTAVITPSIATQVVAPLLADTYSQINGGIVFHHGGGRIGPFLGIYGQLPHLAGVVVDQGDDLLEARAQLGEQRLLMGNLDGPGLMFQTPEQIHSLCMEKLHQMSGDRRFILSTTSADISYDTEPDQIMAIRQAVDGFR